MSSGMMWNLSMGPREAREWQESANAPPKQVWRGER
jgi:hypothetical protein